MASAISANKAELLAIANAVATEKMIDKEIVIEAMEEAIQKAGGDVELIWEVYQEAKKGRFRRAIEKDLDEV